MKRFLLTTVSTALLGVFLVGCADNNSVSSDSSSAQSGGTSDSGYDLTAISKANADEMAREKLSELGYEVTREEGTERAFSSPLNDNKDVGVFACAVCDLPVYASTTQFKSGTGWPSFFKPIDPRHVREVDDSTLGMTRTEIECARCGSHLGHVFNDGPEPTGLRYCMNGVALKFYPEGKEPKPGVPATKPITE